MRFLPRTVVLLGFVSLLNDTASEMITPLLPVFLTTVLGSGPAIVGLIEGVAESTASILKLISGRLADRGVNAKSLVVTGYATSNVARPLIGMALSWPFVLALRFMDRVGKGIRTAPRDAMIAGAAEADRRGAAFGFHRSMDHAGAVIGPLIAYFLLASEVPLATVFYWSAIPGVLVLLLLMFGVKRNAPLQASRPARLEWKALDIRLRAMIAASGLLALSAVPEVFVVLWARDSGLAVAWVPLLWAAASLIKMAIAMPAGIASDRLGRMPLLVFGISARIVILCALALVEVRGMGVWMLFLAYAASLAMVEPAERALVGDFARAELRGTTFGLYHLSVGIAALPGAFLFGAVWQYVSSTAAFISAAAVTALAAILLMALSRPAHAAH